MHLHVHGQGRMRAMQSFHTCSVTMSRRVGTTILLQGGEGVVVISICGQDLLCRA